MAAELKSLQPNKYYSIFMNNAVRPDGRKLKIFGPTSVSVGSITTANGSALVKLRQTTVLCGVKAELSNPSLNEPDKGFIVPNIDFPAVCASRFMPGPPPEQAQIYSQLMLDLFRDSLCISPEDLCISEGKLCWCLYIDITCLNYDGNVLDACVIAMLSALKNTTLPNVLVQDDDSVRLAEGKTILKVNSLPFSATFAVFERGIVADPTIEEESLASGFITVFMQENGSLCGIHISQKGSVSEAKLKQCIRQTKKRHKILQELLGSALNENTNDMLFNGIRFAELPVVYIKVTPNNTHYSLFNGKDRTLTYRTCGMEGFKTCKKGTNIAAQTTAIAFSMRAKKLGINQVRIAIRGLGPGRMSSIKGLEMGGMDIVSITDTTPTFHSGPRPRKARRL